MELDDVHPSEIIFEELLSRSRFSAIFTVIVRKQKCVMKVHHGRGPRKYYEPEDIELDIHVRESTAYRQLHKHGLCDRGIVPRFLGTMRKFNPNLPSCQPHLDEFIEDEHPPSAIFMEFIPNLEMIGLDNYTAKQLHNLVKGIGEIHKALVLHNDPKVRNMMVVKDGSERVVWMDFDRADTFDADCITGEERTMLDEEEESMEYFEKFLLEDSAEGKIDKSGIFFWT